MYSPGTGQIAWSTSGKQTALRILADGKIGIDCNPTVALEVNGTIKASAIDAPIEGTLDDWIVHAGDTNTKIGFPGNDQFSVETGGSQRLLVQAAGIVKIPGTLDVPTMRRQVQNGSVLISGGNATNDGANIAMYGSAHSSQAGSFEFRSGGTYVLKIKSDGKVGINQVSPEALLHVEASSSGASYTANAADTLILERNGGCVIDFRTPAANDSGLIFSDTARAQGTLLYNHADNSMAFGCAGAERLRIDSNGLIANNNRAPSSYGSPNLLISGTDSTLTLMGDGSSNNSSFTGIKFRVAGASTGDYTKAGIFAQRKGGYNDLALIFALDTVADASSVAISDEKLRITSGGQSIFTANKSSEYTARFSQAHADNPAWIEINSSNDNNLRPAYIQLQNNGTNKWGIGQVYQSTSSGAFHIAAGAHSQANSKFTITTGGRVGIGTVNPGTRDTTGSLDIQANLANNGPYFRVLNTHSTYGGGFQQANNNARGGLAFLNASGSSVGNFYHSTGGWTWDQNLQVTGSGGLRVGTTTGNNLLEVRGDATSVKTHIGSSNGQLGNMPNSSEYGLSLVGNNAEFQLHKDGSGNYQLVLGTYQGTVDIPLVFRTDNRQERMRITKAGQVVIGDTDADNAHQNADELIIGNNNSGKRSGMTIVTASNQDGMIHFSDGTGSGQYQGQLNYHHNDNTFRIYTAGQERLAVDNNGNAYFAADTNTYIGHPTTDTLEIKTEGKDAVYITNSQVLSTAKHENKVLAWSGLNDRYWNNNAIKQFVITYYTGASSATYHVCRMISQTDWGFDNIEFKIGKYQYNPAGDDLFSRRFTTYYSSHSNQLINYNQQGSGTGTGAWGVMDWRQDLGPGGAHQIHNKNNGGYYRDCYGSDVYVSLGTYTGIRAVSYTHLTLPTKRIV